MISIDKLSRGTSAPSSACGGLGDLVLSVTLPPTSSYQLDQFGIYFRIIDPAWQRKIFPTTPLVGAVKNGKVEVFFIWPDGMPSEQKPLDLKVEAFFVTHGLDLGPSTVFEVKAPPRDR